MSVHLRVLPDCRYTCGSSFSYPLIRCLMFPRARVMALSPR